MILREQLGLVVKMPGKSKTYPGRSKTKFIFPKLWFIGDESPW